MGRLAWKSHVQINKKNVAMTTRTKVSAMLCFAGLQEVVGKQIVNTIDLK
jgi:hypothetical protein